MLRTMHFRTKLLGILAVPVIGLLAVTAVAATDRIDQAQASARLRDRITVVSAAEGLAQQVRLEEGASSKAVASGDRSVTADQRVVTDAAIFTFRGAVDGATGAGSKAYDTAIARINKNLKALPSYRSSVDLGTDTNSFLDAYQNVLASLSDFVGTVADETGDPGLSRQTAALAALAHSADATASEWAILQVSFTRGSFDAVEPSQATVAVADRDRWLGVYQGLANADARADLRNVVVGEDVQRADALERSALAAAADPAVGLEGDVSVWETAMRDRVGKLDQVAGHEIKAIDGETSHIRRDAEASLRGFLILAGGAALLSVGLGLLLARAVTRPLGALTAAAQKLADEQLPRLVNSLRSPGDDDHAYLAITIHPIEIRSRDEIGKLADAFNTVQTVAVDVAAEQAVLLRKGIGDIFVNLARRNQVLIDRQIEFLDELEAAEDDPDQLDQLYRLDHLATRMRRNAESLLVLAGIEPNRKRTRPVELVDVVRAAIGEVEDYSRVELAAFDEIDLAGNAAVDLGHLLAELLENATHFSPPESHVEVEGRSARNGYVVSITDEGIGMSEAQLAEANVLLANPAPVGLSIARSLGFTVVGRLASRHGVAVRLTTSPAGGVVATVHLPGHLVVIDADGPGEPALVRRAEAPWEPPWDDRDDLDGLDGRLDEEVLDLEQTERVAWQPDWPDSPVVEAAPPTLGAAVPEGAQFEQGLADLLRGDEALGSPALIEPPVTPALVPPAVESASAVTPAGPARRVPKHDATQESVAPDRPSIGAGRRSPEDVRAMLARYRTGRHRGRTGDAPVAADEGDG